VFITLGTGVGGSIVIGRRLVRGVHGRTGEIGHFPLLDDRGCGCGGRSHLESFFSANVFERAGEKYGYGSDMRVLWEQRENRWLARPFAEGLRALSCVFVSLTCLLDPQAIVIGGGLSNLEGLFDDLRDYMFPLLPPSYRPGPELRKAQLGVDAPLLGGELLIKNSD
ncbi:MAG: ROK family protein, partial [Pyramidobacter sp.]|nr:ROK family protein [Pyramidobacter sp.]